MHDRSKAGKRDTDDQAFQGYELALLLIKLGTSHTDEKGYSPSKESTDTDSLFFCSWR